MHRSKSEFNWQCIGFIRFQLFQVCVCSCPRHGPKLPGLWGPFPVPEIWKRSQKEISSFDPSDNQSDNQSIRSKPVMCDMYWYVLICIDMWCASLWSWKAHTQRRKRVAQLTLIHVANTHTQRTQNTAIVFAEQRSLKEAQRLPFKFTAKSKVLQIHCVVAQVPVAAAVWCTPLPSNPGRTWEGTGRGTHFACRETRISCHRHRPILWS